ncbi:helix-turn-helix transcriptional regulator [Geminisphaera colitermitum]|uniref:helix-turn-helix transcriptional regulator n=1 Tax=Geminisphaera colitermitum TaxID=1148786 RepID=UPI0012FE96D4|nr:AraC family transcriptional regulator [Geminisphaera colitermitum]
MDILHEMQRRGWPTRTMLAEMFPGEMRPGDSPAQLHPCNRLTVNLEGRVTREIMSGGQRKTLVLEPGDCLFLPRMAWSIPHWDTPHLAIALVFPHGFLRFSMSNYSWQAGPRLLVQPSPWAWNTSKALGSPGADLLKALEAVTLAPPGDAEMVRHIVLALLSCSIRHLEADSDSPRMQRPAQVWWETVSYLNNNYADPELTREKVATAMGVHPNYLSSLAARESDGFHRTLEAIRMERAKHLLSQGKWSIKEIATQCGYASAVHFSHAFRRVAGIAPRKASKQSTGG